MSIDPKRIAAMIDMRCRAVKAIMQVRTTDKGYPTILDEVLEIVGYADLLTRCESLESDVARVEGELGNALHLIEQIDAVTAGKGDLAEVRRLVEGFYQVACKEAKRG